MAKIKWIIFDADNTLWDVEDLYNQARVEFCQYTLDLLNKFDANRSGAVTLNVLEMAQRHRDLQLEKTHGYSSSRFARSFEDTLMFFLQHAPVEAVVHVRRVAQNVFDKPAQMVENLEQILPQLATKYSLGIISAGELWVQQRRMEQFHLRDKFMDIMIVERKSAQVFKAFCAKQQVEPDNCWVVGDSVRSDVVPAREAGLNAIHVHASNWAAEHGVLPNGVQSVRALRDILPILT
jgi:putative hydrolase of the HAD superfamily